MAESTMTEASHPETSTASGMSEAGSGEEKSDSMVKYIVIALLLFLLVFALIYFLAFSGSSEVVTTDVGAQASGGGHGGGHGGGGGGGGGGTVLPPTTKATSTGTATNPGVATPTSPKPGATTSTQPTLAPHPPTTTTLPQVKPPMLSCTVGHQAVIKDMVPPDGTCDSIFYTDVFFNEKTNRIEPLYSDTAFKVVRSAAATYSKTTFGTSMYPGTIGQFVRSKRQDVENAMTTLFKQNFVDFGMLNVDNIEDYDKLKDGPLQYLRVVEDFQTTRGRHCALGVGLFNGKLGTLILEKAKLATNHFPNITMIVIKVHTERARDPGRLHLVAPNPDLVDLSADLTLSLAVLGKDLNQRMQDLTNNNRSSLLSFAMFARTYRLPKAWTDGGAGTRQTVAEKGLIMEYRMVCRHSNIAKDPLYTASSYVANTTNRFLAMFDTAQNIKDKIATRKKHDMPAKHGGIMAFRADMDDYGDSCGEGAFARLKALKSELLK